MKVKIFYSSLVMDASLHDIERDINEWLLENPYINVVNIQLSASTVDNILRAIYVILYKETSEPNEVTS
jgi:hypothetical protein